MTNFDIAIGIGQLPLNKALKNIFNDPELHSKCLKIGYVKDVEGKG